MVKARLCMQGDMCDDEDTQKDSPTIRKDNTRILLFMAAKEGWLIATDDVVSAFLQSQPI